MPQDLNCLSRCADCSLFSVIMKTKLKLAFGDVDLLVLHKKVSRARDNLSMLAPLTLTERYSLSTAIAFIAFSFPLIF